MPFQHYKLPGGIESLGQYYAVELGEPTPSIPYVSAREPKADMTVNDRELQVNPWMIGQCHTEGILRSHLAKYGVLTWEKPIGKQIGHSRLGVTSYKGN